MTRRWRRAYRHVHLRPADAENWPRSLSISCCRRTSWPPSLALMRTWIGCTLRLTTQGVPSEKNPILFLLDEAGHLGHMQLLQDAVTVMRGYGIRLWFFFQSSESGK